MKLFRCQHCDQVLYFENVRCEKCGHRLGYRPEAFLLSALEPEGEGAWRALGVPGQSYRFCANAAYDVCNWLIPAGSPDAYCVACRHNRTVPDLSVPENLPPWRRIEAAKHRLFYTLLRLRLPLTTRWQDAEHGLAFDFLADPPSDSAPKVMTGHDNGLITIALAEADDASREQRRVEMGEPYRTLLGHFRHEVGHHYWDILVRDGGRLEQCRAVFGDDRQDYGAALQAHYAGGAPLDWQEHFISAYASAHPWEDFAETWAHYLHMVDTLEMATAFGLRVRPRVDKDRELAAEMDIDPYQARGVRQLVDAWLPLTFAMNSLNQCMGEAELYPFILSPAVIHKLGFIHDLLHVAAEGSSAAVS
ncbi:MAG TPA: putative zinc-binding peptidase [Acetobacteraceae bacterium]